jgi:hypothetical protein
LLTRRVQKTFAAEEHRRVLCVDVTAAGAHAANGEHGGVIEKSLAFAAGRFVENLTPPASSRHAGQ